MDFNIILGVKCFQKKNESSTWESMVLPFLDGSL